MKKLHHHLSARYHFYRKWHEHPYHQHHHWLVAFLALLIGSYAIAGAWRVAFQEQSIEVSFETPRAYAAAQLIFNSGFEADSLVTAGYADITGIDRSVSAPNDWGLNTWDYDFNYVAGTSSQRKAEIADDPTGAINPKTGKTNRVLHFWLREAPLGTNARTRVAAQIHTLDRTEWFNRRRIYVHPDMSLLSDFPGNSRVMFEEIKVTETSKDPHFRITLVWANLGKSNFVWEVEGGDFRNQTFWGYQSKAALPIGEWFTIETYYKVGDNNTGRYVFAIQRQGRPKEVLFDVTNWTHHPNITPAPVETWNPQKLYMSGGDDVDWIRTKGGSAQLYFDDWEVWSTSTGGGTTNQPPLPKPGPGPGPITINNQPPRNLLLRYLGPTPTGGNLCGNPPGRIDPGEQCDGTNLNGQTCQTRGLSGTGLSCNPDCTFNTSQCTSPPLGDRWNPPYPRSAAFDFEAKTKTASHFAQFDLVDIRSDDENFAQQIKDINPNTLVFGTIDWNNGGAGKNLINEWKTFLTLGDPIELYGGISFTANMTDFAPRVSTLFGNLRLNEYLPQYALDKHRQCTTTTQRDCFDGIATDGIWMWPRDANACSGGTRMGLWCDTNQADTVVCPGGGQCTQDIDLDQNQQNDYRFQGQNWVDTTQWRTGVHRVIDGVNSRSADAQFPQGRPLILNSGRLHSDSEGYTYAKHNGLIMENHNENQIRAFKSRFIGAYRNWMSGARVPHLLIFDGAKANWSGDYQLVRFLLGATLFGDGYFAFSSETLHKTSLYLDELDVDLGYPTTEMQLIRSTGQETGVWARFFDKGAVIFSNDPNGETVTDADLRALSGYAGPYQRFQGTQDPVVNNGTQFASVNLNGRVNTSGNPVGDALIVVK